MLAVSPLRNTTNDEKQREVETFTINPQDFPEFADHGSLLDSIDFDDLFVGIDDGDVLPDLEMDPDILADFSISAGEESEINTSPSPDKVEDTTTTTTTTSSITTQIAREGDKDFSTGSCNKGEESVSSKRDKKESTGVKTVVQPSNKDGDRGRKSSAAAQTKNANNNQAKRKVKVDWTPELHRRFVQAVEQLGVDKAVPSRILELMGIDCLTRHNIASHLQKYRSHRKHLLAREAEAANWSQRRQMYGAAVTGGGVGGGGGGGKRDINPWLTPTIGFPPHPHFRPLHVWGHPTVDQSLMHMWPKHLAHSPSPPHPPTWASPPHPPPDPNSYWHHPHHQQHVPNGVTPGTPCFPQPMPPTRFAAPVAVPGMVPPHHTMHKVDPGIGFPVGQSAPHPPIDFHPSKESIDAAIGDVLSKPWLPLPLGLKPPSVDGVMVELQRQGIPKVPPTCS